MKVIFKYHVQIVVKSNVIKIDLLSLSLAHGLVSGEAAGHSHILGCLRRKSEGHHQGRPSASSAVHALLGRENM